MESKGSGYNFGSVSVFIRLESRGWESEARDLEAENLKTRPTHFGSLILVLDLYSSTWGSSKWAFRMVAGCMNK